MSNLEESRKDASKISRREMLKLGAAGAAGLTFLKRGGEAALFSTSRFLDSITAERIADRDATIHPPLLIDLQTHVWWRAGGVSKMNPAGEAFLKGLAGYRSNVLGRQVPIADMGRVTFFDEMFLKSETDIAFLNSFGMKAAYDGVDLFPPREAALIRSMAPARVFGIDIKSAKKAVENDLLYKLRQDGNPLPVTVDASKLRRQ